MTRSYSYDCSPPVPPSSDPAPLASWEPTQMTTRAAACHCCSDAAAAVESAPAVVPPVSQACPSLPSSLVRAAAAMVAAAAAAAAEAEAAAAARSTERERSEARSSPCLAARQGGCCPSAWLLWMTYHSAAAPARSKPWSRGEPWASDSPMTADCCSPAQQWRSVGR